ncbi:MAG: aldehyde dehydrogenase family protein [Desulfobacterales bacterium]
MNITGLNFTGKTLTGKSHATFEAENPALGSKIAPSFHEATGEEVDEAIQKATVAFKDYSRKSGPEKAAFLEAIADEMMALGEDLYTTL